jgi:hypothetical protein
MYCLHIVEFALAESSVQEEFLSPLKQLAAVLAGKCTVDDTSVQPV